jgi:hypothetical protein
MRAHPIAAPEGRSLMAKRGLLPPEPSPVDDPFDGRSFIEEAPAPPPPLRRGPGCAGLLGGCLEIMLIAAIALLSCSALSLVLVYVGQTQGVIAQAPDAPVSLLAQLPTVEPLNVPTLPAVVPTSAAATRDAQDATAAPGDDGDVAATPAACADAAAWWRDQQAAFDAFTVALSGLPYREEDATVTYASLVPLRDALSAASPPPCLDRPQAALVRAMEATLSGLSAAGAGDTTRTDEYAAQAVQALADVLTQLWDLGVFTAPDAATTRGIARGSVEDCTAEDWHAVFEPQWQAFRAAAATADPRLAPPLTINLSIGQMNGIFEEIAPLDAPDCALDVARYATDWMALTLDALTAHVAGDSAAAQAAAENAARALVLMQAWIDWRDLPPL